ncbi:MAG: hypothetical protein ACKPKO_13115, partial [Candidatus Fonsibacter sp.]
NLSKSCLCTPQLMVCVLFWPRSQTPSTPLFNKYVALLLLHRISLPQELLVMACLPFQPVANWPVLEGVSTTASSMTPPSGLVEDLSAMGQVEANMDLLIAFLVHGELVYIEEDPQAPFTLQNVVLSGNVEFLSKRAK